ncbi:Dam family site-specific DNA-(adenine-N6)-methyltransferase [Lewinella sp. JB7]|uniref:DNA adenine methylase n=1 Tax=Lewinella sp. JB7 TaxID=2962887 RepID=UPI0020C98C0F|nr:Dam family site-specific DNA-(adenine-N6)-methyltransferase [Lewinella sp. JB7]MCP9237964.1 Dam family site-specific DNA-(adenine-N6)-methyltransferase [Lewinella sp. JB7]
MKPFLRWAGGKSWFVSRFTNILPKNFDTYHEPFLGGAAIFLSLNLNTNSILSDSNEDLINVYRHIRDNLQGVLHELDQMSISAESFYEIRSKDYECEIKKAAQFIYLNRTCYNGLYRVNLKGKFNVPYGKNEDVQLYDKDHITLVSKKLQLCEINASGFEESLSKVRRNDLVFIDPPYTVAHNHNGFVEYNQRIFSWEDQIRLARCIERLHKIGAFYVVTNAMHQSIIDLYSDIGQPIEIPRHSTMAGQAAKRKRISELVLTNCM